MCYGVRTLFLHPESKRRLQKGRGGLKAAIWATAVYLVMSLSCSHPCRLCGRQPGFAVSPGSPARFEAICRLHLALDTGQEAFRDALGYLFQYNIDNQAPDLSMKLGWRREDVERSAGMGCVLQTESVGSSHSNVGHIKMYLWPLACRAQGDLAVFLPFPPWGRDHTCCHSSCGCFPASERLGMVESSREMSCRD